MPDQPRIVWLSSYPRSGNTWVRMLLTAYRDKAWSLNHLVGESDSQPYFYDRVSPVPILSAGLGIQLMVRPAALLQMLAYHRASPTLLKTHSMNNEMLIPSGITVGSIHIVRDPRDVAVSWARWFNKTIDAAIDDMNEENKFIGGDQDHVPHLVGSWSQHVNSWTEAAEAGTCYIMRYEDLHILPEVSLAALISHLGETADQARIEHAIQSTNIAYVRERESLSGFIEAQRGMSFFGAATPGGWAKVLTPEQAALIESHHGNTMERYGYAPAGSDLFEAPAF
jgi:hypothetical protein